MADLRDENLELEDDYDEDADSDFDGDNANEDIASVSSEEEPEELSASPRPKKRRKAVRTAKIELEVEEQASGDEEVIGEHKKIQEKRKQKQKRKGKSQLAEAPNDEEDQGWRARTRAMREREKVEKKKTNLATTKGSTVDVDKIWEEMNRPSAQPQSSEEAMPDAATIPDPLRDVSALAAQDKTPGANTAKENTIDLGSEEMVTIQESYVFAGKTFTREVKVPKSSINEPRMISKESSHVLLVAVKDKIIRRPLRRISRFDPNGSSDVYKKTWTKNPKLKKINVLTKTAGDWEEHVEAMGDRGELDEHAKSKEGYLSRQDFLQSVEHRKEEEARLARLKH